MEGGHLALTWDDYEITYRQMISSLRTQNVLTDVTLACDGEKFPVHKLVLVTCSDFFKLILGDAPCEHPIIYMKGIRAKEMKPLLDFMYLGKIELYQHEVSSILSTAEALQIKGLGGFPLESQNDETTFQSKKRKLDNGEQNSDSNLTFSSQNHNPSFGQHSMIKGEDNLVLMDLTNNFGSSFQTDCEGSIVFDTVAPKELNEFFVPNETPSCSLSQEDNNTKRKGHPSPPKENHCPPPLMPLKEEKIEPTQPLNYCLNNESLLGSFSMNPINAAPQSLDDARERITERPFICAICQKTFAKSAILKRHHFAHFRPYKCNLCQRSFTRKEVLSEHMQEHSGTDMRLPCPVCQVPIKRKRNLQAHIKVKHPEYYKRNVVHKRSS